MGFYFVIYNILVLLLLVLLVYLILSVFLMFNCKHFVMGAI